MLSICLLLQTDRDESQMEPWIWWILEGRALLPSYRFAIEIAMDRNLRHSPASPSFSDGSSGRSPRQCSPVMESVVQYLGDVFQQRLNTLVAVRRAIVEVRIAANTNSHLIAYDSIPLVT